MRHSCPPTRSSRGFTLIELLVVVIILAILAAIVVPQFSSASADTQEAALDANLVSMRNAIELYKVQHGGAIPGSVATSGGTGCATGGTLGSATVNTEAALKDHLLTYSDAAGHTCTVGDSTVFKFGPYLKRGIPADPIKQVATVTVTNTGVPLAPSGTTGGWAFDTKSGQIVMNSSANDSRGNAYSTH